MDFVNLIIISELGAPQKLLLLIPLLVINIQLEDKKN